MSGIIDCEMHIGDEVFVHGYIDEIRNDTIIIRNVGGYFGTSRDEVFYYEEDEPTISKMEQVDKDINVRSKAEPQTCEGCKHKGDEGCEQPCLGCNGCGLYEPKDEPTTQTETQNSNLTFEKRTMRDCYNCKRYETEGECIECHYEPKVEPQTVVRLKHFKCPKCGRSDYIRSFEDWGIDGGIYKYKCINCNTYIKDEPQTDCAWK